jgi:hypothetical protein
MNDGMKNWKVICLTLLAGIGFSTGVAQARDDTYAGVGCQVDDDGINAFDRLQGLLQNLDNNAQDVFCPIIRDETSAGITRVRVTVFDNNANQDVTCVLIARQKDGTNVDSLSRSTVALLGVQDLLFGPLAPAQTSYYTLRCSVPGSTAANGPSAIASYRVEM